MAALKYWLWLSALRGVTPAAGGVLLTHFGDPERVYYATPADYAAIAGISPSVRRALENKSLAAVGKILADCERLGIRMMTLHDALYPARLREIPDPPLVLYLRGRDLAYDDEPVIAVVGSRRPSVSGLPLAERFGLQLARHGALVISGGAAGIDTAALRGALAGGGNVAAVIACGLDVTYPRENYHLFQDIAAAGAVLSEYPPGTEALSAHFPVRNRILSGLSVGVLAVEAELKSGTMITTRLAGEHNRDLYAVPGPPDARASAGTNWLIQSSQAKLVMRGWDIMEEYTFRFPGKVRSFLDLTPQEEARRLEVVARKSEPPPVAPPSGGGESKKEVDNGEDRAYIDWQEYRDRLTDDQRDALLALGERTLHPDELIEATQIPVRRLSAALTILEVEGMVRREPTGKFTATVLLRM